MNILGVSAYYHDSAAALVRDGTVVAAAQEERFTRKKHDRRYPEHICETLAKKVFKHREYHDRCFRHADVKPRGHLYTVRNRQA